MPCNNCKRNLPIVNKKYGLCPDCNSVRLTGSTLQERHVESVLKFRHKTEEKAKQATPVEYGSSKLRTPIKKQTSKEAAVKLKLSTVKQDIRLEAIQNNEYFCKGCGCTEALDCSHILSVGQYKALELVKENIQLMCRQRCHRTWESAPIEEQMALNCFADNLIFIYGQDMVAFNKFITRIEEYARWLVPEKDQVKLDFINNIIDKISSNIDNN